MEDNIINVNVKENECFLTYKNSNYKCAIGKNGAIKHKIEGDDKTPLGIFEINEVFYRKDKINNLATKLPLINIEKNYGWCDVSDSSLYNKFIILPSNECINSSENLYRDYDLYDIILPIGYNKKGIPKKEVLYSYTLQEKTILRQRVVFL